MQNRTWEQQRKDQHILFYQQLLTSFPAKTILAHLLNVRAISLRRKPPPARADNLVWETLLRHFENATLRQIVTKQAISANQKHFGKRMNFLLNSCCINPISPCCRHSRGTGYGASPTSRPGQSGPHLHLRLYPFLRLWGEDVGPDRAAVLPSGLHSGTSALQE